MRKPFDIPADTDTPVSAWLKLAPLQPRFLLESVEGGERLGRYSFIGFGPAYEVRLDQEGLRVGGKLQPRPASREALMAALRDALKHAPRPKPEDPGIPFHGGLVGASSYDLVRYFEPIGPGPSDNPGEPEAAWVATPSILVFDHSSRRAALLHDGDESSLSALRAQVMELLRGPLPPPAGPATVQPATQTLSRDAFIDGVRRTQEHILAGDVFQLVLSVGFSGKTDVDPFAAYRALRLINPSPYMYFCDLGELKVVGSSPEALVRLRDGAASLRPIAGTRPRGVDDAHDDELCAELLADEKENAEHVMLVDLARNDIGRVAIPGSVRVDPFRAIERYSHVMHMVSGVSARLEPGRDAFDTFAATFPAGTLVGAPKVRAMQIIDELEPVRRGFYGGTVGYFDNQGGMDQAIAIRTLIFNRDSYRYQAGAGIVADSNADAEFAEVLAKGAALRRALEIAGEGL